MTNRPHGEEGGPLSREDWQLAFDRLLSALWVLPAALEMLGAWDQVSDAHSCHSDAGRPGRGGGTG